MRKIRNSPQFEAASDETTIPHGQGGIMARELRDALKAMGASISPRQWHNATRPAHRKKGAR